MKDTACVSTIELPHVAELLQIAGEPRACQRESITPAVPLRTPIQSFIINTTTRLSSKINSLPFFCHGIVFDKVHLLLMRVNLLC